MEVNLVTRQDFEELKGLLLRIDEKLEGNNGKEEDDCLWNSGDIISYLGWGKATYYKHKSEIPLKKLLGRDVIRKSDFMNWVKDSLNK